MTQVVERVRRMRSALETAATFGTEISLASFVDVIAREDSVKLTLDKPLESPMLLQQHVDGYPTKVALPKAASLDFATNLAALTARATGLAAVANHRDHNLWQAAFGASFAGTGTTIASTSTVTALNVTSAAGLREGGAIACATGVGGALECRVIKTIAANVVTLKAALSSIPSNGSAVYGCITYYLDATLGSTYVPLQATIEGLNSVDRWLLKGGAPKASPTIECAPGTVPKATWSWQFAQWLYANGVNTTMNLTSSGISDQDFPSTGINSVIDSEFRLLNPGVTALTSTLIDAPEIKITPQVKYGPHKTPAGVNTIKQFVRLRNDGPAAIGEFTLPFDATDWFDARDANTEKSVSYQIGSSVSAGAVLLDVPRVMIDNVQREEVDGLAGIRANWYAKLDNQTSSNSNNLQKSVCRVHVF